MALITSILSSLLLALNTVIVCSLLFVVGLVRALLPARTRTTMSRYMDRIIDIWVGGNRLIFRMLKLCNVRVEWENAEALSYDRWYLVVSNHQSWTDIVLLQVVLWRRIPPIKFFTKKQLIWIPFIGVAMWLLGFPYVSRMSREQIAANPQLLEMDRQATLAACEGFREYPTTVLNFLEGTRFTEVKHQAQTARFEQLLNPKIGGLAYVTASLGDRLHKLLDVTISYPHGVPTFWEFLQGRCREARILIQCRDLPEAVGDVRDDTVHRQLLGPWVDALWREKDRRLASSSEHPV